MQRDNLRGGERNKPNKNADFPLPYGFPSETLGFRSLSLPPPLSRIFTVMLEP